MWQTGRYGAEEFQGLAKGYDNVQATTFITRMDLAYRAADLVVSRAGAGTISELQILGKPVILIPSPNVAEDHQRKNAEALASRGAAKMILDADADSMLSDEIISLLRNEKERNKIAAEALKMGLPEADEKIVDKITELVTNGK